jgi:anthranilate phosphoribosyltransferase
MNAAAALVAAGRTEHLKAGADLAAESIDSGSAAKKLEALVSFTQKHIHHGDTGSRRI